jgi:alpha-beta hydrolase superfamily lysophospholipase
LSLESLPRFTFGASSGGMFSSIFAINQRYKIQGQIIFISIVDPEILQTHVKAKRYPPTAWIYVREL